MFPKSCSCNRHKYMRRDRLLIKCERKYKYSSIYNPSNPFEMWRDSGVDYGCALFTIFHIRWYSNDIWSEWIVLNVIGCQKMLIPVEAGIIAERKCVSTYLMLTDIRIQLPAFLIDQWQPFIFSHWINWNRNKHKIRTYSEWITHQWNLLPGHIM